MASSKAVMTPYEGSKLQQALEKKSPSQTTKSNPTFPAGTYEKVYQKPKSSFVSSPAGGGKGSTSTSLPTTTYEGSKLQQAIETKTPSASIKPPVTSNQETLVYAKQVGTFRDVPTIAYFIKTPSNERQLNPRDNNDFSIIQEYKSKTNVLQARTKEQQEVQFKRDVLGKSGIYYAFPYAGQQIERGARSITHFASSKLKGTYGGKVSEDIEKSMARLSGIPFAQYVNDISYKPTSGLYSKGIPIGSYVEGAIQAAPLAAFDVIRIKNEPKIEKISNQVETSTYREVQKIVLSQEAEPKVVGQYVIKTEVTPPKIQITTLERKWLGASPIYEGFVSKPRAYVSITPFASDIKKPITVAEVGPRQRSISLISGASEEINIKALYPEKITPIQKQLVNELLPASPENFKTRLISKEDIYLVGDLKQIKYYKGPRNIDVDVKQLIKGFQPHGKRITSSEYITKVKEINVPKELDYEVYKGKLVFKDTTRPLARASGKTQSMEGITYVFKEPEYKMPSGNIEIIDTPEFKTATINTDQISKAMTEPIQKIKFKSYVKPITPKVSSIRIPKGISGMSEELRLPRTIAYSGTNKLVSKSKITQQSTKTYSGVLPIERVLSKESSIDLTKSISRENSKEINRELSKGLNKELSKELNKELEKEMSKSLEKELNKELEKTLEKNMQKELQKELQKGMQKQTNKQIQKTISKTAYKDIFYPSKITKLPKFGREERSKKYKSRRRGFDIFVIKKGKPVTIARGLYKEAALDVGAKSVLSDLKATFGIRESQSMARDISTGREFERTRSLFRRPTAKSRYNKYGDVFIQKQTGHGGRLTFQGEIDQIQAIKRYKRKSIANMIR